MYRNVPSCVRVSRTFSDDFLVQERLNIQAECKVFRYLLESLSREIRSECSEELLYADDNMALAKHRKEHWSQKN